MRLCTDKIYRGSPQLTTEHYVRHLTRSLSIQIRERGVREEARDREPDRSRFCGRNAKWMQMERHERKLRNQ